MIFSQRARNALQAERDNLLKVSCRSLLIRPFRCTCLCASLLSQRMARLQADITPVFLFNFCFVKYSRHNYSNRALLQLVAKMVEEHGRRSDASRTVIYDNESNFPCFKMTTGQTILFLIYFTPWLCQLRRTKIEFERISMICWLSRVRSFARNIQYFTNFLNMSVFCLRSLYLMSCFRSKCERHVPDQVGSPAVNNVFFLCFLPF